ncbi:MAG TPA: phage tail protein [Pseudomonas sp.]|nr:phage tail protein [Pseudomonas sp.]
MTYMEYLQSSLAYLIAAGEAGQKRIGAVMEPMNGAISDINEAAAELEGLPIIGELMAPKLQRTLRAISVAQAKVAEVVNKYNKALAVVRKAQDTLKVFEEKFKILKDRVTGIIGKVRTAIGVILPSAGIAPQVTPAKEAVKPFPHLLVLQPLQTNAEAFYFNLDTAGFQELKRSTRYNWAGQDRLTRTRAQQGVGIGEETITLTGVIYPALKSGIDQLKNLRSIGKRLKPLSLTTGHGDTLGAWCLTSISEEQSALLAGGIPRKQGFTLEFVSYGDDMPYV